MCVKLVGDAITVAVKVRTVAVPATRYFFRRTPGPPSLSVFASRKITPADSSARLTASAFDSVLRSGPIARGRSSRA